MISQVILRDMSSAKSNKIAPGELMVLATNQETRPLILQSTTDHPENMNLLFKPSLALKIRPSLALKI